MPPWHTIRIDRARSLDTVNLGVDAPADVGLGHLDLDLGIAVYSFDFEKRACRQQRGQNRLYRVEAGRWSEA